MGTIATFDPMRLRVVTYQRDTTRDHEQAGLTETPGIFYHGSADVNITEFRTGFQRSKNGRSLTTAGIFFTHNPTYAANFATGRAAEKGERGGRVYAARLMTKNPLFADPREWVSEIERASDPVEYSRKRETEMIEEARIKGHDAIISYQFGEMILEAIVIDPSVIVPADSCAVRVPDWRPQNAFDTLTLFQPDGHSAPFYAPQEAVALYTAKQLAKLGREGRKIMVDAANPLYLDRAAWPLLDFDVMRHEFNDCLVDPVDRGALLLEPEKIVPLNRKLERAMRAELRRVPNRERKETEQVTLSRA